jgi:hypothetical protein
MKQTKRSSRFFKKIQSVLPAAVSLGGLGGSAAPSDVAPSDVLEVPTGDRGILRICLRNHVQGVYTAPSFSWRQRLTVVCWIVGVIALSQLLAWWSWSASHTGDRSVRFLSVPEKWICTQFLQFGLPFLLLPVIVGELQEKFTWANQEAHPLWCEVEQKSHTEGGSCAPPHHTPSLE